jgi:hypothetical protein
MSSVSDVHVPFGSSEGEVLARSLSAAVQSIPFVITIPVAAGATKSVSFTVPEKIRVIDAWGVQQGAGETSDTIQVLSGTNAITDAMSWAGADKALVRAASIDAAYHEIAKGGTLKVTMTDADAGTDGAAGVVYVLAVKVK